ncbi:C2H2-like zinc finger protein [Euphorbia peplus]|nr:C2H2-like zinc finger protein [Euphorbia peplus]
MERHKCKLCTRTFANGRALGGHMKAHLSTLPLPPKTAAPTLSSSSSYSSSGEELEISNDDDDDDHQKAAALAYRLRENPRKSFRFADPEFSFAVDGGSVVQDRESETESRNPTRRRSKRTRKSDFSDSMKQNFEAPAEPEPVSSVSDTSPEEDVAMCLMMLSRDVWMPEQEEEQEMKKRKSRDILVSSRKEIVKASRDDEDEEEEMKQRKSRDIFVSRKEMLKASKDEDKDDEGEEEEEEMKQRKSRDILVSRKEISKVSKIRSGKFRCDKCTKLFRSSPALTTHRKICGAELGNERIFECPYCYKVFGSGQALGGHKRSHLRNVDASVTVLGDGNGKGDANVETTSKMEHSWIDLNLPAPMEDDEFSVVSDA